MLELEHLLLAQSDTAAPPTAPASEGSTDGTTGQSTQPGAPPPGGPPVNPMGNTLMALILAMVVFYIVLFMGRGKKQKKFEQMLRNLKKNDRVVTIGGIVGTVVSTRGDEVVVKVDESTNTKMTFVLRTIQRVLSEEEAPE